MLWCHALSATYFTRAPTTAFGLGTVYCYTVFCATTRPGARMVVINMRVCVKCHAVRHGAPAYQTANQRDNNFFHFYTFDILTYNSKTIFVNCVRWSIKFDLLYGTICDIIPERLNIRACNTKRHISWNGIIFQKRFADFIYWL